MRGIEFLPRRTSPSALCNNPIRCQAGGQAPTLYADFFHGFLGLVEAGQLRELGAVGSLFSSFTAASEGGMPSQALDGSHVAYLFSRDKP